MNAHHSHANSTYDVIMHRHHERIADAEQARLVRTVRRARRSERSSDH